MSFGFTHNGTGVNGKDYLATIPSWDVYEGCEVDQGDGAEYGHGHAETEGAANNSFRTLHPATSIIT